MAMSPGFSMIFPTDPVLREDQNEMAKLASVAAPTGTVPQAHSPRRHRGTEKKRRDEISELRREEMRKNHTLYFWFSVTPRGEPLRHRSRRQRRPQRHDLPGPLRHRLRQRMLGAVDHLGDHIHGIIFRANDRLRQSSGKLSGRA